MTKVVVRKWLALVTTLLVGLCVGYGVVVVRGNDVGRESLQGLRGVDVLVESLRPEEKVDGLSEDMIQTAVELKLRSLGIKVVSGNTSTAEAPNYATFYVNVAVLKLESSSLCAYSVNVSCQDRVKLRRQPYRVCSASIWQSGMVGQVSVSLMSEAIKREVTQQTEYFANDYLAANPK